MKHYRNKLKLQTIICAVGLAVMIAILVLSLTRTIHPAVVDFHWTNEWNSIIYSLTSGFTGIFLVKFINNMRALRDPEKCKALYIKESDERTKHIWAMAGSGTYWPETVGLALAAVIGGYFSPVVCFTALGCLLYIVSIRGLLKIYYTWKY